jgi:hypothetical protein
MTGPKGILWEFCSERIMGMIARSVTSRRFPFSQLSNYTRRMEQFKMVQYLYNFSDREMFLPSVRDLEELSRDEQMFEELSKSLFSKEIASNELD